MTKAHTLHTLKNISLQKQKNNDFNIRHNVRFMFKKIFFASAALKSNVQEGFTFILAKSAAIFCVFILSTRKKCICFTSKSTKNFKKKKKRDSLNFNSTIALHFYAQLRTVPVQEIYSLFVHFLSFFSSYY